ncbi:LEA type 2 family protein [Thermococcus sp.]|uniref:LEA type 2 family protein n=1 Tax=Thermococcus sp. TaxID=35749 RepID=UPI00262CD7DB|nr:LEA type 2 family protein [Thermococcus sp.]
MEMGLKTVLGLVTIAIILWVGYVVYAAFTSQPEVNARWGQVTEDRTEIVLEGRLNKPLAVPLSLENLTVEFMGIPVMGVEEFNYSALGKELEIVLAVENRNLVRALVRYLDNGQRGTVLVLFRSRLLGIIPIDYDLRREVSEDILASLNFTAESREIAGGLVKTPALVGTTFDWAGEEKGKAVLIAHMKFYNPNRFPVPVGNVSFEAYANDIKVAYGETRNRVVIPANGYAVLDLRAYIIEDSLPKAWVRHVRNGEVSRLRANVFLSLDFMGQSYRVRLASYEETMKTEIMETLNEMLDEILG